VNTQTQGKNRKRRIGWKGLLLIVFVLYALVTVIIQQTRISDLMDKKDQMTEEKARLEQEKEYYKSQKDYIGSDEYIEQKARDELGWVKEDEIIFKDANASDDREPEQPESNAESGGQETE